MEERFLICAPIGQDAVLTKRVFDSAGLSSVVLPDLPAVLEELQRGAGALLLVEEAVRGHSMTALVALVAAQPTWSDLPILLLTRRGADSLDVQRAVKQLGNVTLLERPVRSIALVAAARAALRARNRQYQVREAERRKDEFLATLAHELRNPLAPIRSSMGILAHLQPDSPPVAKLRQVVNRQVTHLTRLVDDLLNVARITNGKVALKKDDVALQWVIDHAVEISASSMQAKDHRLTVRAPLQPCTLHADLARLVQIVANLLVNAAKFTPAGGAIALEVDVDGSMLTVRVIDNGIGLEPASLGRIFELFAQTPVPGEAPTGLGIGLSLAKQFAEMHGGELQARSAGLGCGSEFALVLPVVVPASGAAQESPAVRVTRAGCLPFRRLLVVDDNVDGADTLSALLEMDGFDVTTRYDGPSAVAAAADRMPDAIVMDIGMPGLDGYDAALQIRAQPGGDSVVLIALTGWGQTTDRQRARDAGFDHHLVKPVDYDRLLTCLEAEAEAINQLHPKATARQAACRAAPASSMKRVGDGR
jgi:signal transduction histidine kinase/ActR/RegA family two-component response regulator